MGMSREDRELIAEAARDWRKRESFEHALGRVVKRRGHQYEDYLRIIEVVRRFARERGMDLLEAARALGSQQK